VRDGRMSAGSVFLWTMLGAAAGVAVATVVGDWLAAGRPDPLRAAARAWARRPPAQARRRGALARAVEVALHADPRTRGLALAVATLGAGSVELHGWVDSRAARAHAARVARRVPGVVDLVNGILVRGEDDREPEPRSPVEQPA